MGIGEFVDEGEKRCSLESINSLARGRIVNVILQSRFVATIDKKQETASRHIFIAKLNDYIDTVASQEMPPLGRKTDKQWRFVGQSVSHIDELTPAHIRSVFGLCADLQEKKSEDASQEQARNNDINSFPYCHNMYKDPEGEREPSKAAGCSAARCKDHNPHCLNYMGQDQWEREGIVKKGTLPSTHCMRKCKLILGVWSCSSDLDALVRYLSLADDKPNPEISKRSEGRPAGMKVSQYQCDQRTKLLVV